MKINKIIIAIVGICLFPAISSAKVVQNGLGASFNKSVTTIPLRSDIDVNNKIVADYYGVSARYLYAIDDIRYLKLEAGLEGYNLNGDSKYLIKFKDVSMSSFRFMVSGVQYHGDQKDISLYSTLGLGFILVNQSFTKRDAFDLTEYDNIPEINTNFVFSLEYDLGLNVPLNDDFTAFLEAGVLANFQDHIGIAPHLKVGASYWFE